MGCTASSSSSPHCEYPASGYNPNGVQETLDFHQFHVQAIPDRSCKWRAPSDNDIDPILYTFPMLHTRLSALTLAFSAESIDPSLPKPALYLEIINIQHDVKKYSIAELSCSENNLPRKYGFSWKQHEMVEDARPGDILRLRCHLKGGQRCKIRNLIAEMQGLEDGIPIVRLPFEEILDVKENRQTLEMRSYRSWYFRERGGVSVGWVNSPVIKSRPDSIELTLDVTTLPTSRSLKSESTISENTNSSYGEYSFSLSLIRQGRVVTSCVIVQGIHEILEREGSVQSIHFHVDERSENSRARRLITSFAPGDVYQIDRKIAGEKLTVKVTKFSLLITSRAMTPICGRLYHQVLLSYLKPIVASNPSSELSPTSAVERRSAHSVRRRNYESKEEDESEQEEVKENEEDAYVNGSGGREFPLINYYYDPHDHGEGVLGGSGGYDGEVISTSCYGVIDPAEWNFGSSSSAGLEKVRSSEDIRVTRHPSQ